MGICMIRSYEERDFTQVTRIWIDARLQECGFIPTDLWRNGINMLKMSIDISDVYVCADRKNIHGFIELDGSQITGLFAVRDHRFRKTMTQLLEHAGLQADVLTLHAFCKDEECIHIYEACGYVPKGASVNEFTNEPELIFMRPGN